MKGQRVLITGICGFVGSTLALEFRRYHPDIIILGIDNLMRKGSETNVSRIREAGVRFEQGDIRNP
jgi:CDP-paratose 2-epimerase